MKKIVGLLVYLCLLGSVCLANIVAPIEVPSGIVPPRKESWYENPTKLGTVIVLGIIVISVIVVIIKHKNEK